MLRNWEEKVMTIKGTHREVELAINKIKANNRCKYNIIFPGDCDKCECIILPIEDITIEYID